MERDNGRPGRGTARSEFGVQIKIWCAQGRMYGSIVLCSVAWWLEHATYF